LLTYHILDWEQRVDVKRVSPPVLWASSVIADHDWVAEHGVVVKPPRVNLCDGQYEQVRWGQPVTRDCTLLTHAAA